MSDTEGEVQTTNVLGSVQNTNNSEQRVESESRKRILELKRKKRSRKAAVTRIRHTVEKLCVKREDLDIGIVEKHIETLWEMLEKNMVIMDELSYIYSKIGNHESQQVVSKEAEGFEAEVLQAIEKAESVIQDVMKGGSAPSSQPISSAMQTPPQQNSNVQSNPTFAGTSHPRLKPLQVPVFDGFKTKFQDFWALFTSLVDEGDEPTNIKMARLRQSVKGTAHDAIRGLGVSEPEYEEAKTILQSKFGGKRRELHAYMDQLEALPSLKGSDVKGLERFADLVRISVVKLQADGRSGELGEGTLHGLLVKKLGDRQVESYSRWLRENKKERSVINLKDWLKEEVKIRVEAQEMVHGVEGLEIKRNDHLDGKTRYAGKSHSFFAGCGGDKDAKPPFALCEGKHGIWSCRKFQSMGVEERWEVAKSRRLCFRCLGGFHQGRVCTRSKPCNILGCTKSHHALLHGTTTKSQEGKETEPKEFEEKLPAPSREGVSNPRTTCTNSKCSSSEAVSLRTIPVWLKANDRKVKVNAILDDASNETFLNEEVAGLLGIQEPFQTVKVHVLNDEIETFQSMPVSVNIESVDGEFSKCIHVKTCPQKVTGNYKVEDWRESMKNWAHLRECDFPKPAEDKHVDLLIGVDHPELHFSRVDIRGAEGGPVARLGLLGWTCIGLPARKQGTASRSHVVRTLLSTSSSSGACCDVNQSIKRFWEIENSGSEGKDVRVYTEEEKMAMKKLEESLSYDSTTSRYKIGVPWKEDRPTLPDNHAAAVSRLFSTERKLGKDKFLASEYQATIKGYIEKGYLRHVTPEEKSPLETWYLPHFPVVRMDKTTTKVRIVFDCSDKCKGISLNDVIYTGPKLQRELIDVLVRFRRNPVAVACDVKEMYLQVEIEERDRPMFRILWRDLDTTREPEVYEFSRVVFGKNSAPMESQFVSQENARKHQREFPRAAETILKSTYMDDSIDSVNTDEEGIELYQQLDHLWRLAGMTARKWVSNSSQVIAATPKNDGVKVNRQ